MLPPLLDIGEIHRTAADHLPGGNAAARLLHARDGGPHHLRHALRRSDRGQRRLDGTEACLPDGEAQSARRDEAQRERYMTAVEKPGFVAPPDRWFQDNTREPIRDETLRDGLVRVGAVVMRTGLPTTSSKGRYALQSGFASLFRPGPDRTNRWRRRSPHGRSATCRPGRSPACACSNAQRRRRSRKHW